MKFDYEYYMSLALKEAKKAYKNNEVPVGAILVDIKSGEVIAKAYNKREKYQDISFHAEILALKKASKKYGNYRLNNCFLVVTLFPCLMCQGAILQSQIKKVIVGTLDDKLSEKELLIRQDFYFDNNIELITGIKEEECKKLLKDFFQNKRKD